MTGTTMLVNYVPGDECRVALVEQGMLEEFHSEPATHRTRVGSIYVGVVTNVEPSIQAAFIDFGVGDNGFLHVTDLHPRYFPGGDEEDVESVGRKTPRKDRPPIQQCLRRGQEIAVQVIKEGHGSKGPSVTSYLSIPGRYIVMMPLMDRVGVSRKVEDEDERRKMKEILEKLELPDGFGFILRTAGFDRNKTDLKRDLAYLMRLWKDMELRWKRGKGPRLLYSESDLLLRAMRDLVTADTGEIVIDHEKALERAGQFLKIVSPRTSIKLFKYTGNVPIFHAYGVEEQILNIHAREVPLPSGGRLVIDETEALVAIDVNSGKSRSARDSESNAVQTNLEAVDEICRQLRLRDLGGLVINDMIDMREAKNRKKVEARFKERLARDRAKSTTLPISQFGILEMTRQRMRGSHESVHFAECPSCHGRGVLQRAESLTSDALRQVELTMQYSPIRRVELVVGPRVASELLSKRRRRIAAIERATGKTIEVRVSESMATDRFSVYAYDETGSDVDVDRLRAQKDKPAVEQWVTAGGTDWADESDESAAEPEPHETDEEIPEPGVLGEDDPSADGSQPTGDAPGGKKRRRRRRRRGGDGAPSDAAGQPVAESARDDENEQAEPASGESTHAEGEPPASADGPVKKKRRRRRKRGGSRGDSAAPTDASAPIGDEPAHAEEAETSAPDSDDGDHPDAEYAEHAGGATSEATAAPTGGKKRRRRRRRGGGDSAGAPRDDAAGRGTQPEPTAPPATSPAKMPRVLYTSHRKLSPAQRSRVKREE